MDAKQLIGKRAVRTKAAETGNGGLDWSYCGGDPVKIINATDSNVVIETKYGKNILDARFVKNWVDADSLMKGPL